MHNTYDNIINNAVENYYTEQTLLNKQELFCLVKAIIHKESGFNSKAIHKSSKEESIGLMQINIRAHNVSREAMLDPVQNINYGTRYLVYQLKRYNNLGKAISAYNAGKYIAGNYLTYVVPVLGYYNMCRLSRNILTKNDGAVITQPPVEYKEEGYIDLKIVLLIFLGLAILSKWMR